MERSTSFADEFSKANKIAQDYIYAYYRHLSRPEERSHMPKFYRSTSSVLWNEYHQHGRDAIAEHFGSILWHNATMTITSLQACPGGMDGGVMVLVTGCMQIDETTHEIIESFYLEKTQDSDEDFYISSQILKYVGPEESKGELVVD